MKAVIERIGGTVSVLAFPEESTTMTIPSVFLPAGSSEGDILDISIDRDEVATQEARDRVSRLIGDLIRQ